MIDLSPTPAQLALQAETRRLARDLPPARDDGGFSLDGWRACAELGVLGWPVPAEFGGAGHDPLTTVLALEALGYGCRDNGLLFAVNNHLWACTVYLLERGSPEQKRRFLPRLCDGTLVGAHAMTEPEAGSDVLSLTTTAERRDGGFVLNGLKTFVTNAPVAGLFAVLARTGGRTGQQDGLSVLLVSDDLPGVHKVRELPKAGLRGAPMGEVRFEDCLVPEENLLGREGGGYAIFIACAEWERGFMMATQVGVLERILEDCVRHARTRRQFGQSVGGFQAVAHRLADLRVRLELAQLLVRKLGWLKREGRLAVLEASMAKLFVSESLLEAAITAVRVHGARGYVSEYGIAGEVGDALGGTIAGGTSDIHRNLVAELLGLPGSRLREPAPDAELVGQR